MPTHPAAGPAPAALPATAELTEEAMRVCDDLLTVYQVQQAARGRNRGQLTRQIGVLLGVAPHRLCHGGPMWAAITAGTLNPRWRDDVPARPDSLWSQLEALRTLLPPPTVRPTDVLEEYQLLLEASDDLFMSPGPPATD